MSNGATNINIGDLFATFFMLVITAGIILFIISVFTAYKRNLKRADERLHLEQQQTLHLQKQVDDLNERVRKVESLLREVD